MLEYKQLCPCGNERGAEGCGSAEHRARPAEAAVGRASRASGKVGRPFPRKGQLQLSKVAEAKKGRAYPGDGEELHQLCGEDGEGMRLVILGEDGESSGVSPAKGSLGGGQEWQLRALPPVLTMHCRDPYPGAVGLASCL